MTSQWTDSNITTLISKILRHNHRDLGDSVLLESMDSFSVEFRFLATFLGYTRIWSDAHKVVPNLDAVVIKIAATAKAFRKDLHNAYVDNYSDYYIFRGPKECTVKFAIRWRRTRHRIGFCGSKPSTFVDVFARLNKKIELLKPEITEAYSHLPSQQFHDFHPLPPTCIRETSAWGEFCESVEQNLEFLVEKYDFAGPLGKHMKGLKENLCSLRLFLKTGYFDWSPWKDDLLAHFGEVAIRAAHVCCLCWYTEMDQNVENDMAILLADLQQKIDLACPEFLGRILVFLGHYTADSTSYRVSFVKDMLGLRGGIVLHNELVSLVTYALKIQKMEKPDMHRFSVDIKAVFVEARYLRNIDYRAKTDLVLLFARIWFLKADIFLKEQLTGSTLLMLSVEDQIEALHEGLTLLRVIFTSPNEKTEAVPEELRRIRAMFPPPNEKTENQMLALVEQVPGQVEYHHQSSHANEFLANKVRDFLYRFLVQIMLFKAKELLLELLNRHGSFIVGPMKCKMETLNQGLILVLETAINQSKEITEDEKLILTYIEAMAAGVTSLCNSFPAEQNTGEAIQELDLWLCDLLEMVQLLKAKLKELYFQVPPRLNFPKTPGMGFIELLWQKLGLLLSCNHASIAHVTHQIQTIHEDFEFLISNCRDFEEQGIENQELKDLYTRLIHVAYEGEYVIDLMMVQSGGEWNHLLWLYHVSEEIRHIKMQLTELKEKVIDVGVQDAVQTAGREISQSSAIGSDEDVVILNDQQQVILDRLTRGSLERDIVSIVGMPGIGKTTLANKVYNDPEVQCYFHIRALCRVSQVYTKRDLLLELLGHVIQLTDNILANSNEDLELVLYKQLKRNRYLIFMDDMWNVGAWDDLQSSFPDDRNGSRILITSRLSDLVSKVTLESNLLSLRLLSDKESWQLLKMKIFPKECYAEELFEVGIEIARNCQGLPLSVVAIAGLLKGRNMNPDSWKQIAEGLNSLIVNDPQTRCMDILELSYKHLPDYLKACFIYVGAFQEDKEIPVWRLTWLWMAEGFIQKKDSKSLEELAEDYLRDLIGRSLITVAKRRLDGGVKACRAHDMIRALCLLKAKQEHFLELVTNNDEPYASFDDNADLEDFDPSDSVHYEEQRLSIYASRNHFVMSRPTGSYVRSLLFFATPDMYPRCPYDISFISRNFKLLKVLDLECINMGNSFAAGVDLLLHLGYLAVCGDIDSIPSSLANLTNLETFLVKGLKGKVVLPDTIWRMTRLRHLHVKNSSSFTLQDDEVGNCSQISNLVSLSSPSLSYGEHAEEIIRRLPSLRKLSCIFSINYSTNCNSFPRLEELMDLESLKILYRGKTCNTSEFKFPLRLKKLTLSNFFLRRDHISTIGRLEYLEVLKLLSTVFEDTEWEMSEGEFPQLKFLKLEAINIVEWNASSDHLPNLQHLVLRKCENLREVPIDLVDIPSLHKIEVQRCRDSVEKSVLELKEEEQCRYGTQDLKIIINH